MPDAALCATELQFMRLIGSCNQIAQFYVYPFTVPGLSRGDEAKAYIDQYYSSFEQLQKSGLDALIITGANVEASSLDKEPFWQPLNAVMTWAAENVTSVLCSCLSTHALVKQLYHIDRQPLPEKLWGVFSHRIVAKGHPLLRDINTRFDVPHSRYNAIQRQNLEKAGLTILIESEEGGVHMAVSPDQYSIIYFQGHPEYDYNSLLKEYKREVLRYMHCERKDYPPYPEHYFSNTAAAIAERYKQNVHIARQQNTSPPPFPEVEIEQCLDNTWGDTGKAIFNNWLGMVYQKTDFDLPRRVKP